MASAEAEELHEQLARLLPKQETDDEEDERLPEGSVLVAFVVVGAFITPDGDPIVQVNSSEQMPVWQIKGLLDEGHDQL